MKKIVLAYSGGLDTSCAVKWLQEHYGYEVICFSAFIGEVKDKTKLIKRAKAAGALKTFIVDLKDEFAKDYILPAIWAHARYEGKYPLATALGRPMIAKHLVEVAEREGAEAVAHGCTGKGNDQVRLEVGVRALNPDLKIIAPLREWEFKTREEEIEYAREKCIPIDVTKKSIYSIDKNIWGIAIEAGILEDPMLEPPEDAYVMTKACDKTPKKPRYIEIGFVKGVPVSLDGKKMPLVTLIDRLNAVAGAYGVGRFDMIENRLVGIKSREVYEAPAADVLLKAHDELEGFVMDREFIHYKRVLSEKYAELVYFGLWFSPLRKALDAFFASNQARVTGKVRIKLDRGHAICVGRESKFALYREKLATYSKGDLFDRTAATGFMKLWGLPYEGMYKS
ncbi:MAG TPA: argininosuccinate synthase [Candidatus Omnitrophota bacterium]|jgi:argininosuccinate synthase|nr:MAG: Argininosuccinate synthase [Candidatus Omnitrophica bacterium ADurb.Bin314]HOE68331.1 argininosuccinate synthase [Candidatus Omnitrophota bacterium]HQB94485.1 argininosuccinate synthase [Candidatus Omnitrophota bacterium]